MMAENFSEFIKDMTCQIQESLGDVCRKNQNNSTSRHIRVKTMEHQRQREVIREKVKKQINADELTRTDSKILNTSRSI